MKRTPLRAKRPTPRRNEGRVAHRRMKRTATSKTSEEAAHIAHVASLGCLICGAPANVHHLMHAPGKERRRDHRWIAPLCREHHQGDSGVHGKRCGSEEAFKRLWGVDLVEWAGDAWIARCEPDAPFWRDGVTRCRAVAWPVLCAMKAAGSDPRTNKGRSTRLNQPLQGSD